MIYLVYLLKIRVFKGKDSWGYQKKEKHIHWLEDVVYDSSKSMIYNDGEGWKMYEDDYYCIIDIGEFISKKVPDQCHI